jgi:hypothetical protein
MIDTIEYNTIMNDAALTQEEKAAKVQDIVAQHIKEATAPTIGHEVNAQAVRERLVQALEEVFALRHRPTEPPACSVTQDEHDPTLWHFTYEIQPGLFGRAVDFIPGHRGRPEDQSFLDRYFHDHLEYPDVTNIMMEPGVYQEYVSTTFLNGWINHVEVKKAFLITRYSPHDQNLVDVQRFNQRTRGHTDLSREFADDVLVLAVEPGRPDHYWFFWADRDCSDSGVGRFITADSYETVAESFTRYAQERSLDLSEAYSGNEGLKGNVAQWPALELDADKIEMWVTL